MEKQILEQYADIQEEHRDLLRRIEKVEAQLEKMNEKGYVASDTVTCGKRGRKPLGTKKVTGFPFPEYTKKKRALKQYRLQLQLMDEKLHDTLNKVDDYINSVEDSRIRRILRYRYIDDMNWVQVAHQMGKNHTPDSCRKVVERFLEKK